MIKLFRLIVIVFCLLLSSCSKSSPTSPETPKKNPPVINSFAANPSEIKYGESSTLSWGVSNATKVEIDQGIGVVSSTGNKVVKPEKDTTYTLTASNNDGTATKTAEVKVKAVANVIMLEGPIYEESTWTFTYKGIIKNIGNVEAQWVRIYVYIRKSNNDLITYEYTYADDYTLSPGESSAWDVSFWDDGKSIRNQMDKSKTTFEIKWE